MPAPNTTADHSGDERHVDRLISLWTNQNTVLHGRVQNLITFEVAVIAAWYLLMSKGDYWIALFTETGAGLVSLALAALVLCDLKWKDVIGTSIRTAAPGLLPEVSGHVPGWITMTTISVGVVVVNMVLGIVTAMCIHCGHLFARSVA